MRTVTRCCQPGEIKKKVGTQSSKVKWDTAFFFHFCFYLESSLVLWETQFFKGAKEHLWWCCIFPVRVWATCNFTASHHCLTGKTRVSSKHLSMRGPRPVTQSALLLWLKPTLVILKVLYQCLSTSAYQKKQLKILSCLNNTFVNVAIVYVGWLNPSLSASPVSLVSCTLISFDSRCITIQQFSPTGHRGTQPALI